MGYLLTQAPILIAFGLLLLLASTHWKQQAVISHVITVAALALSAILTAWKLTPGQSYFGGAIHVTATGKALAYAGLALSLIAVILAESYLDKIRVHGVDFRLVVLAQALGLFHLPLAGDLATLFVAFELVSIPSYVLAGFNHHDARADEAGLKYLILGVFASSLFLLGLAFLYGATGAWMLPDIQNQMLRLVIEHRGPELVLAKAGLAFLLAALLFKTGSAPAHIWLSDVYDGANLASLAFIAAPAKVAAFGLIALILWGPYAALHQTWQPYLMAAAIACAVFGNLQAVAQTRLKRLLAYSSVANAGFLLLSLMLDSIEPFLFYLVAYALTTLGLIASFMAFGTRHADIDTLADLQGLGRRYPVTAAAMTLMLFSLAGIPFTAGFAAKFGVVSEALKTGAPIPPGLIPVLAASLFAGLISFFFYFKMIRALWLPAESGAVAPGESPRELNLNSQFVLGFCVVGVIGFGLLMRLPGFPWR